MSSPFRENNTLGRLMMVEPDQEVKLKYTIWFDYTRRAMNIIQDGDFIAVPNFGINHEHEIYSILKLTNIMPMHFALGSSTKELKGYPGFLMESAKNIVTSWRDQVNTPLEDTTKISCEAIPTGLEFEDSTEFSTTKIRIEKSLGMLGEEVRLLSSEMTNRIVNGSLEKDAGCFPIGCLTRDEKVQVYLRMDDLLKTHFGVFGFTGVGKSNLISTIIAKLLNKGEGNIKIVLFDLMDEYTGLLFDLLMDSNLDANIIYYGEKSLPGPVIDFINKTASDKKNARNLFLKNLLLPKGLRGKIGTFITPVEKLLDSGRIKIMAPEDVTVQEFLSGIWEEKIMKGSRSRNIQNSMEDIKEKIIGKYGKQMLTKELAKEIMDSIIFEDPAYDRALPKKNNLTQIDYTNKIVYSNKYLNSYINNIKSEFRRATSKSEIVLIDDLKMTKKQFIEKLQQKKKGLYIITSHDQDQIRRLSKEMGDYLYEERRKKGIIEPNVVFVFDEADEFIPQSPSRDSQKESKKIIETLTRRGRKFGIGVGIATQRSSYLDTNIMGQLHTYFISKLPREYDRKVVGDAFSLSENEFIQTFKFSKGQWLLVSHDALGIDSVALPIKTENAEERIVINLESIKTTKQLSI